MFNWSSASVRNYIKAVLAVQTAETAKKSKRYMSDSTGLQSACYILKFMTAELEKDWTSTTYICKRLNKPQDFCNSVLWTDESKPNKAYTMVTNTSYRLSARWWRPMISALWQPQDVFQSLSRPWAPLCIKVLQHQMCTGCWGWHNEQLIKFWWRSMFLRFWFSFC